MSNPLKMFQIDDTEWYAAETSEQAIELYRENGGEEVNGEPIEIRELTDAELDRQIPAFDEDECPIPDTFTSGREMLGEMTSAGFVASSAW